MRERVEPFRAMAIGQLARALEAEGRSIIHMEFGQPSTGAPAAALAAVREALDRDPPGYWESLPLRQRILEEPSVQQCYYITGEADYLLVLTVASMEAYAELTERLFAHDTNVRRFRTSVALGRLKAGMQLPLPSFTPTPPAGATA